ncbi:MAG: hypothetical protein ACYC1U_04965 [Candidatus Aquicultorales bacterium]
MDDSDEIKQMLEDLIWLNTVIATELIQITENTSKALHGGTVPEGCVTAHAKLREQAVAIAERYKPEEAKAIAEHVLKH